MELNRKLIDLSKTCKICLEESGPFYDLNHSNLADLYEKLTSIQILKEVISHVICETCMAFMLDIENFIAKCKLSDEILKKNMYNSNEEVKIEIIDTYENDTKTVDEIEELLINPTEKEEIESERQIVSMKSGNDEKKKHKCDECGRGFKRRYLMIAHKRVHSDEAPFECKICLMKFKYAQNFHRHNMNIHEGIKPFACDICGKVFARASVRDDHFRIHTGENPYLCKYCGKTYTTLYKFKRHLDSHENPHENQRKSFKCSRCDKMLSTKYALSMHEKLHNGEKRFLCTSCGKEFYTKAALDSHYRVHSGARPFKCDHCEKKFSQSLSLKNHILIHTGEKPYICDVCQKGFKQIAHLKNHKRTHTGEKPYVCEFCNKSFSQSHNLKVHVRTHTGETPYHCSVCDLGFYDSSSMKKHRKKHMIEKEETKTN